MQLRHIWGLCPLCALPVAVGQVEAVAESPADICRKLVETSREVDQLLRTISDRESGQAAAAELKPLMEYMLKAMEQLSTVPVETADDAHMLEDTMRDLMHITQGYTPVLQRLVEVNGYGSEELISLFRFYKMDARQADIPAQQEETPLVRSYGAWCDRLEDVLYQLRKITSAELARQMLPALESAVAKAETCANQVEKLQAGLSPQQLMSEQVSAERLRRVGDELRQEIRRLRSSRSFGLPELDALLLRCAAQIRG